MDYEEFEFDDEEFNKHENEEDNACNAKDAKLNIVMIPFRHYSS